MNCTLAPADNLTDEKLPGRVVKEMFQIANSLLINKSDQLPRSVGRLFLFRSVEMECNILATGKRRMGAFVDRKNYKLII